MPNVDLFENDPARLDELILVDAFDRQIGTATKEQAHREDLLHRAFSVVLTREGKNGPELLVARRSKQKYHSGDLWANSCCSHPRNGEDVLEAAKRRTQEELGVEAGNLREISSFVYRAVFDNGISEYEYDHVFVGECLGEPVPDPAEASEVRWLTPEALMEEMAKSPDIFAVWSLTVFPLVFATL